MCSASCSVQPLCIQYRENHWTAKTSDPDGLPFRLPSSLSSFLAHIETKMTKRFLAVGPGHSQSDVLETDGCRQPATFSHWSLRFLICIRDKVNSPWHSRQILLCVLIYNACRETQARRGRRKEERKPAPAPGGHDCIPESLSLLLLLLNFSCLGETGRRSKTCSLENDWYHLALSDRLGNKSLPASLGLGCLQFFCEQLQCSLVPF
ncbi:hypothetical protein V8F33_000926 [Rhypophila sp. PSN 637]